jgi:hypothetical protein
MSGAVVTVSDLVMGELDGQTVPRWAVVATFVGVDGTEPRCVDYRVRVIPGPEVGSSPRLSNHFLRMGHRTLASMEEAVISPEDAEQLGEVPAEGIPRRVFELASQARLLDKATSMVERRPERYQASIRQALGRRHRRRGRPPARSLAEKLRILAAVEDAFATSGRTLAEVAAEHHMSREQLRDLLSWARHDAQPRLFVSYGPGRRGGHLTPQARDLLQDQPDEED